MGDPGETRGMLVEAMMLSDSREFASGIRRRPRVRREAASAEAGAR